MATNNSDWETGYCDPNGIFLGYNPSMMLIPGLIPARYHKPSGRVEFTGNPKIVPQGQVLRTEETGVAGQERVLSGLIEDTGAGLAPTGAVPGTAIPEAPEEVSEALANRIALRNKRVEEEKKALAALAPDAEKAPEKAKEPAEPAKTAKSKE